MMLPSGSENRDRRRFPRRRVRGAMSVELRVGVSSDKPAVLLTRGNVADISCGGLKCNIGLDVPVGTRVDVRFPRIPKGVSLEPHYLDGQVVRTESLGGAPDRVAIAFAHPLDNLEMGAMEGAHDGVGVSGSNHFLATIATSFA